MFISLFFCAKAKKNVELESAHNWLLLEQTTQKSCFGFQNIFSGLLDNAKIVADSCI
jgi:hypothetical protein